MSKRNLIMIAILGLIFVFSANVFGQNNKRKRPKAPVKSNQRKGGITHTDSWHSKTKRKPRTKSIIILDQDGETEVARKKRRRNK